VLSDLPIGEYLRQLSGAQPTPGGGAAAAITAAQAAALLSMVANLTLGKKKFAEVETLMRACLVESETLREACLVDGDADMLGFGAVMRAYRQPKATVEQAQARSHAVRAALRLAAEPPLSLFNTCVALLRLTERVAAICNPAVQSDVDVARHLAMAALYSAQVNVEVNLCAIEADPLATEDEKAEAVQLRRQMSNAIGDVKIKLSTT
jgi:methenyltetrahydrofolate cyclohydrolase